MSSAQTKQEKDGAKSFVLKKDEMPEAAGLCESYRFG
jgi:hypothetical protein